jgi:hypothetical protein
MKRLLTACGLLSFMIVAALAASAVALPNYAGTWVLDKDKSKDLPPSMAEMGNVEIVVKQDEKQLTVNSSIGGGEITYMLDGSKTKAQMAGRMPGEATVYLEKKDDGKVILHASRELNFQGNAITITITEAWELADNGKTLKAKRKIESPRGAQEMELVFNLKSEPAKS